MKPEECRNCGSKNIQVIKTFEKHINTNRYYSIIACLECGEVWNYYRGISTLVCPKCGSQDVNWQANRNYCNNCHEFVKDRWDFLRKDDVDSEVED